MSYIQDCSCMYCNKYSVKKLQAHLNIPLELVNIIYSYTGNNRKECYCGNNHCYCTCLKCHPDNGKSFCITVTEYQEINRDIHDDYCNGWE